MLDNFLSHLRLNQNIILFHVLNQETNYQYVSLSKLVTRYFTLCAFETCQIRDAFCNLGREPDCALTRT